MIKRINTICLGVFISLVLNAQSFKGTELFLDVKICSFAHKNDLCELFDSMYQYTSIYDSSHLFQMQGPSRIKCIVKPGDTLDFKKDDNGVFSVAYFDQTSTICLEINDRWIRIPKRISERFSNLVELNIILGDSAKSDVGNILLSTLRMNHVIRPRYNFLLNGKKLTNIANCKMLDQGKKYIVYELNNLFYTMKDTGDKERFNVTNKKIEELLNKH